MFCLVDDSVFLGFFSFRFVVVFAVNDSFFFFFFFFFVIRFCSFVFIDNCYLSI